MAESTFQALATALRHGFEADDPEHLVKHLERGYVQSIQRMIEGLGTSDLLGLLGEMDPEVGLEIHAPVLFPWIRRAKGLDQVRAAVVHNFSTVEAQQTKVLAVVAQGHVVDVTLRETG